MLKKLNAQNLQQSSKPSISAVVRTLRSLLFHNVVHILSVYPIIPKTAHTRRKRSTHLHLLNFSLTPVRVHMCTRIQARDEGVNVYYADAQAVESLSLHLANPRPVYFARNNALDVALPSGRGKAPRAHLVSPETPFDA